MIFWDKSVTTVTVVSVTLAAFAADAADNDDQDEQQDAQNHQNPPVIRDATGVQLTSCKVLSACNNV